MTSFTDLEQEAKKALIMLERYLQNSPDSSAIQSMLNQMEFIVVSSKINIDPTAEAISQNKPFYFGVMSSRLFASPEELIIKEQLDKVSNLMTKLNNPV